jgi:uncharacterized protein YcbX
VIQVGEDIDPTVWSSAHPLPAAGRKMNAWLHAYFETELARAPAGAVMNEQATRAGGSGVEAG